MGAELPFGMRRMFWEWFCISCKCSTCCWAMHFYVVCVMLHDLSGFFLNSLQVGWTMTETGDKGEIPEANNQSHAGNSVRRIVYQLRQEMMVAWDTVVVMKISDEMSVGSWRKSEEAGGRQRDDSFPNGLWEHGTPAQEFPVLRAPACFSRLRTAWLVWTVT